MQPSILPAFFAALTLFLSPAIASAEVRLLMVEEEWCNWCEKWHEEIGPIYGRTDEGRLAPLRRTDKHEPMPEDVQLAMPVTFTPTFVLLDDGAEVGRIEGYPGEDFFWGLLQMLIAELPEDTAVLEPGATPGNNGG